VNTGTIDLNCDLGEREDPLGIAGELAILDFVCSANIACGGHAGDERSMARTVAAAMERGVALGAHPGYPDRTNFGRVPCEMPVRELEELIAAQVDALLEVVVRYGGELTHLKLHGALYHEAMRRRETAEAVGRGVERIGTPLLLVGLAGAPALEVWRAMGFSVASDAFADRRYESDGSLRPREEHHAIIDEPAAAAAQAVRIAKGLGALTLAGGIVGIQADTICLHSDTPNATSIARIVHDTLTREGIRLLAFRR